MARGRAKLCITFFHTFPIYFRRSVFTLPWVNTFFVADIFLQFYNLHTPGRILQCPSYVSFYYLMKLLGMLKHIIFYFLVTTFSCA